MPNETQKHTPGPWKVLKYASGEYVNIGPLYSKINYTISCTDADARLISAAPDMLRCLEEGVGVLETLARYPEINPWLFEAKVVIAKATGNMTKFI